MGLTKRERDAGYKAVPQPSEHTATILRRVARGFLLVTHCEDGEVLYCYDDGTPIRDLKSRLITGRQVKAMIRHGWLLPIKGESLIADGPPQRYRARTVEDGPLPRWRQK